MRRIGLIARREFLAAVANRGFVIGLLLVPVLGALFAIVSPRLFLPSSAPVRGSIAVIDPTGAVGPAVRDAFAAPAAEARREDDAREALRRAPQAAVRIAGSQQIMRSATGPRSAPARWSNARGRACSASVSTPRTATPATRSASTRWNAAAGSPSSAT